MTTKDIPNVLAFGIKNSVWIIGGIISIGVTFGISQYRITELEKKVITLEADRENVVVLKTQMAAIQSSIDELKQTNKDTYRLLLDMSKN